MIAVRDGEADVCAVDAVCAAMAGRYRPDYLEGLVEIARSSAVPGLPYVTALSRDPAPLRAALMEVMADAGLESVRAALYLSGLSILPGTAYSRILSLEQEMERRGGLRL